MKKRLVLIALFIIIVNVGYTYSKKERNLLNIHISSNDQLMVNGKLVDIDSLKNLVKLFILNPKDSYSYSEKREDKIEFIGDYSISKGIISIKCERNTTYKVFIAVQNEIERAFTEMRNDLSLEKFNKSYKLIPNKHKNSINKCIPKIISEAEPDYVWKNGKLVENYYNYY